MLRHPKPKHLKNKSEAITVETKSPKNLDVQNLIIEKSNFNFNNQNYDFFVNLLDSDFKDGNLIIKNSNIFFKNKDEEVLFINKILDLKYFYDQKFSKNKIKFKSEIFNLPYELELNKNDIEKKIFTVLNLGFSKLNIENELDFSNEVKKGSTNFKLGKNKFSTQVVIPFGGFPGAKNFS